MFGCSSAFDRGNVSLGCLVGRATTRVRLYGRTCMDGQDGHGCLAVSARLIEGIGTSVVWLAGRPQGFALTGVAVVSRRGGDSVAIVFALIALQ